MPPHQQASSFRPNPEQSRRGAEKSVIATPPPANTHRRTAAKTFLITVTIFTALTLSPSPAHPQGCTQCLDNTAATPPATQRAYRRVIVLLTLTAGGLFATTLVLFKRHR